MKKTTFFTLFFLLFTTLILSQSNVWKPAAISVDDSQVTFNDAGFFELETGTLRQMIKNAPSGLQKHSNIVLKLPIDRETLQNFAIYEASNFSPELQVAYPTIRSYIAIGIDDPSASARISISPYEFYATLTSGNFDDVTIEKLAGTAETYVVYAGKNKETTEHFDCEVRTLGEPEAETGVLNSNDGLLRTFRLALSTTSDYSSFHLQRLGINPNASTTEKRTAIMSAVNMALTKLNAVFERDVAIRLELVSNTDELFFLDQDSDPFTFNDKGLNINENQNICDNIIGSDNYDIGHVLSAAHYGGLAYLGAVCWPGYKGGAASGLSEPVGDSFYMIVAHEMGHQFGANHSFNNPCGGNVSQSSSIEPGSGTTIMSYAGACPPNVMRDRIHYFNSLSIQEMWIGITRGNSQCGVTSPTNNGAPTATTATSFFIPKSTPFVLEGQASDPDDPTGAGLTYSWEQFNPQEAPMPPRNVNTVGPLFLINEPLTSPVRYMPNMETIRLGATENRWEVVPSVSRIMNFRFLVRDNAPGGGATASANTRITVDDSAGPFVVTSQNSGATWTTRTTETITWDVANTDAGRVNAAEVRILFSADGGYTYPHILADGVPNNGSARVPVPNINTSTGRVMVRGKNNIFFDINNSDIIVTGELNVESHTLLNISLYPNPGNLFTLKLSPPSPSSVELTLYDLRGRIIDYRQYDEVNSKIFEEKLDYNYLQSGVYFMVIKNGGSTATKKLIKE